ncbi:DgyrCDS102 [Dimorphilus gyrociliatus]|uniref:DgyrCDS102 n=1 Tax=Dimorphilus gyrociliatus TaxID=2664684 RepID=A0A7I8V3V7_9ANNE|nr:DgyrCDS102 [Dimorphilus gyrociliatus]
MENKTRISQVDDLIESTENETIGLNTKESSADVQTESCTTVDNTTYTCSLSKDNRKINDDLKVLNPLPNAYQSFEFQFSNVISRNKKNWKQFFYDKDDGTFLKRTPFSWLQIILFYAIFWSCLAGFFIGGMNVIDKFFAKEQPNLNAINGNNNMLTTPGLMILPEMDIIDKSKQAADKMIKRLRSLNKTLRVRKKCSDEIITECRVLNSNFIPSEEELRNSWQWTSGLSYKPYFMFRLNRVHGWEPEENPILNCQSVNAKSGEETNELIGLDRKISINEISKDCYPYCSNNKVENQRYNDPYFFVRLNFNESKLIHKDFVVVQCKFTAINRSRTDKDFLFRDGVRGIRFGIQLT